MGVLMFIRVVSDVHLEFGNHRIVEMPTDKDTILVIAGDLAILQKPDTYRDFLENVCNQFHSVIYVYGNHEFYHGTFTKSSDRFSKHVEHLTNLYHGYELDVIIDNVAFVGSILWTNFGNSPIYKIDAKLGMNDFRYIQYLTRKFTPDDAGNFFDKTLSEHIIPNAKKHLQSDKNVVIISHHAPSFQSIHPRYKNSNLNYAYASDLEQIILDLKPKYWIHGHVHDTFDYKIDETRIICNPVGYVHERNPNYNPTLILEA